jgi:hypothetical protein
MAGDPPARATPLALVILRRSRRLMGMVPSPSQVPFAPVGANVGRLNGLL